MKRDMELVRQILLSIQQRDSPRALAVTIAGQSEDLVEHHVKLLVQAGFIEAYDADRLGTQQWKMLVVDMTWAGHEFLASIENETVWAKMKTAISIKQLAAMPVDVMKTIGTGLLMEYTKSKVGL